MTLLCVSYSGLLCPTSYFSESTCHNLKRNPGRQILPKSIARKIKPKAQRAQHDMKLLRRRATPHSLASLKVTSIAIDHLVVWRQCRRDIQLVLVRLTRVERFPGCIHRFVCAGAVRDLDRRREWYDAATHKSLRRKQCCQCRCLQILDKQELGCLNGVKIVRICNDQNGRPGLAAIDFANTLTVEVERQAGKIDEGWRRVRLHCIRL